MTLVVLALDALEPRLIDHYGLDVFHLEQFQEIETYSHMKDIPYTLEVWPTVATGLGPDAHGITKSGTSEWQNPIVNFMSRFTGNLSDSARNKLGNAIEEYVGDEYTVPETTAETVFDQPRRVVHNWPGVHRNRYLLDVWRALNPGEDGQSPDEFEREIFGIGIGQFAWAKEMLDHNVSLAGVHIHTLDMAGHVYSDDKERYRGVYEWTASQVEELLKTMGDDDELLVMSDHGMGTEWTDGAPGTHTEWAFASTTTADRDLFDSVYTARDWIDAVADEHETEQENGEIDFDEQQLKDLGYI